MASLDIAALVPARLRQRVEPLLNTKWNVPLLVGGALAATAAVVAILWLQGDSYSVLYAGLSAEEGGRAIADLQKQNIPYRVAEGGGVIQVPSADLGRARLELATQGVPKQDADQWGLIDNEGLGVSPFVEEVHYNRAIESMLAGTIRQVDGVMSARVALAMPKQTDFLADAPKPSASVMVRLRPGAQLTTAQVAGIAGLVAAGVPGLTRDSVTIVDQTGKVLTSAGSTALGQVPEQLGVAREIENRYESSIDALLMPVLGPGNFRVSVAADVDFTHAEESAIKYGGSHVLSEDDTVHPPRDGGDGAAAIGIPGALSNRPPSTPTIVQPPAGGANGGNPPAPPANPANPPNAAAGAAAPNAAPGANGQNGAPAADDQQQAQAAAKPAAPPMPDTHRTTNYDLDHTVEHLQHPAWALRGLSVAVLLNHSSNAGSAGGNPDRIQAIKTLIASAIGAGVSGGEARHVEVVDLPFGGSAFGAAGGQAMHAPPPWMNNVAQNGLVAVAGLLLLFAGLSPVLRRLAAGQAAAAQAFGGGGDLAFVGLGGLMPPRMGDLGVPKTLAAPGDVPAPAVPGAMTIDPATVRALVLNQPGRTAQVIKGWIARDAGRLNQAAA